jgi:Protein of unknown function (DUF2959)
MKTKYYLSASITALALVLGGCASTGYEKAGHTTASIEKTAREIHKGNGQIDAVLFALSSMVNNPEADIKPQFAKFDAALGKLESLATDVSEQNAAMQAQGAAYFRNWDAELAKIQNEDIRSRSAERKGVVAARFEKMRVSYVNTKATFQPFLSDLKDIRTSLATDLTTAGVASIKSTANNAQRNVTPLRESMSELEADFKALGVSLSASSK